MKSFLYEYHATERGIPKAFSRSSINFTQESRLNGAVVPERLEPSSRLKCSRKKSPCGLRIRFFVRRIQHPGGDTLLSIPPWTTT